MALASRFSVVIPASGVGKRMQASMAKQYLPLLDKTVIEHTINCFLNSPEVDEVVVVIAKDDTHFSQLSISKHPKVQTVIGGKERANSVYNGVKYLVEKQRQWLMVHDAARPCLEQQDIINLAQHCFSHDCSGILATPVRDTMKRTKLGTNIIDKTEDRNNLWHALTPQCAKVSELYQAFTQHISDTGAVNSMITDEASALELAGKSVKVISGSAKNIKITQPEDLDLAEYYLKSKNNEF